MSEHTPGPWEWDGHYLYGGGDQEVMDPEVSCGAFCLGGSVRLNISDANARLIAAAPDLLWALEYIVAWENGLGWNAETSRDLARAAIAKARGTTTHTEGEG